MARADDGVGRELAAVDEQLRIGVVSREAMQTSGAEEIGS